MSFDRDDLPDELRPVAVALEGMAEPFEPPADLEASVMAAVAIAAASEPATRAAAPRRRPSWWRRPALSIAAVAAAVLAVVVVTGGDSAPVEVAGVMEAPGGAPAGEIEVARLDSGRRVHLESDRLAILPQGDYYEVWFVGKGDTPGAPDRISGGTFHPDEQGNTDIVLHAAVDPALFPLIEITAEPGNGRPGVDGPVVARLGG